MNWIDIIMLSILIHTTIKGLSLGLVLSIFNLVQVILSLIITRKYYSHVYSYIVNNPMIYNIFKGVTEFILKILFYSKNKIETNFISDLLSKGLLKIIISLFAISIVFWLTNKIINLFLEIFSFLLKTPVLKQVDKVGGVIFGLIQGLFLVYLLSLVLSPIGIIFPDSLIGKGILNSWTYNYFEEVNLILDFFSIDSFI